MSLVLDTGSCGTCNNDEELTYQLHANGVVVAMYGIVREMYRVLELTGGDHPIGKLRKERIMYKRKCRSDIKRSHYQRIGS